VVDQEDVVVYFGEEALVVVQHDLHHARQFVVRAAVLRLMLVLFRLCFALLLQGFHAEALLAEVGYDLAHSGRVEGLEVPPGLDLLEEGLRAAVLVGDLADEGGLA
jgi:hypothetical protein